VADAGIVIDPVEPDALAAAILSIIEDSTLRSELITRGANRSSVFTWQETARQTLELLMKRADLPGYSGHSW